MRKVKAETSFSIKHLVLTLCFLMFGYLSFATHQRAGYITYKHLSGMTYEITIVTYTYTPSPADRPKLGLSWGDGSSEDINRTEKLDLANDISKNTYIGQHTYTSPATYTLSVEDKNRNGGILNIPNSVNTAFYIETTLTINPFLGPNSSPNILNPPIEDACINEPFEYNPSAYDTDGDSLSYVLVYCKGEGGLQIPGYSYPVANNSFSINPVTGDLYWDSPQLIGEYNVAFHIEEWRSGVLIGYVTVDMQILVSDCDNRPPVIADLTNLCVEAGTHIAFPVSATDPDTQPVNNVTLTATGLPFLVTSSPAIFPQPTIGLGHVSSNFSWQTECLHVRKNPYSVVFKAKDNGSPVSLVNMKTVFIRIVAPAPQNLTTVPLNNGITLNWDKSICDNAKGYKIYRKNAYYGYFPDSCETGVPAYTGYSLLTTLNNVNDTSYFDNNNGLGLPHGNKYCYMVIAYFPDGAESYASLESCTELPQNTPVITNVSIRNTDVQNGSLYLAWSKPKELDTLTITGPYKYLIYRSMGLNGINPLLIDSLSGLNDTIFIDTLLNTLNSGYAYKIDLINDTPGNRYLIGSTQKASSVFLSSVASNRSITLTWDFSVPWFNLSYIVYRKNLLTLNFDSIGTSNNNHYKDTGLTNGITYCYKIKAIGDYTGTQTISPLLNLSQIKCDAPIDTIPPCQPFLRVTTNCDAIANSLFWHITSDECFGDVVKYNIYYSPINSESLQLIYSLNNRSDTFFLHNNLNTIAGCYAVTAVDSFNNESPIVQKICLDIDSCSLYTLPNVFTPNNDSYNDFFIPFPYHFVDKIDIKIFNRWGNLIFETENPDIKWDGKNNLTNIESSSGVYYYVCDVYERRLGGLKKRTLTGFFHLMRGDTEKAN